MGICGAVTRDQWKRVKGKKRAGEIIRSPARSEFRNSRGYKLYYGLYVGESETILVFIV